MRCPAAAAARAAAWPAQGRESSAGSEVIRPESGRSMIVPGFRFGGRLRRRLCGLREGAPGKEAGREADREDSIHSLSGEARDGLKLSRTRSGSTCSLSTY